MNITTLTVWWSALLELLLVTCIMSVCIICNITVNPATLFSSIFYLVFVFINHSSVASFICLQFIIQGIDVLLLSSSFLLAIDIVIHCRDWVRTARSWSLRSNIDVWCSFMNGQIVEPPRKVMGVQLNILHRKITLYIYEIIPSI